MNIDAIRSFIHSEFLDDDSPEIGVDEDLMLSGALDSTSVMQLIAHIEERANIEIAPEDVVPENFGSLQKISDYLAARRVRA